MLKREFDESPLKTLGVLVGLVVGLLSLGGGIWKLVQTLGGPPYHSATSRLIIIDASASMGRRFSPERKYDSAATQILRDVKEEPSVDFALRFTDSGCDDSWAEPPVFFVHNDVDRIKAELTSHGRSLHGQTDLSGALRMGLEDFRESKRASGAKEQSIWLFLGTPTDACHPGGDVVDAIREIKSILVNSKIEVSHVDFFALKTEQKTFERLKRQLESIGPYVNVVPAANTSRLQAEIVSAARREAPSTH